MSVAPTPARRRPVVVTIAIVLVYVTALSNVAIGVLILLSRYRVADKAVLTVSLLGSATILLGLLMIAIASGLARGSGLSRILVTIYLGIAIALHVVTIASTDGWDWSAVVQATVNVLILVALWAPPGSRHFGVPAQTVPTG